MAGFSFGTSHWDDLPQQLGMTVTSGVMSGLWRGVPMEARFYNEHDRERDTYHPYTTVVASFDPPLGADGTEVWDRIAEPALRADVLARGKALGLKVAITDNGISGTWSKYESGVARYQTAFELFAWAAHIIIERRATNPPPWEIDIAQTWPSLAQGWGLQLDLRRGTMSGLVRGLPISARVRNEVGAITTGVEVTVPMPPGASLKLLKQDGDGFFAKMFRGQDIIVGDPAFDAAFVIKGEPEAYVRAALTPIARQQILGLAYAGFAITLEDGKLIAWARGLLQDRERLDQLMKAAYAAATAIGPASPGAPVVPYR